MTTGWYPQKPIIEDMKDNIISNKQEDDNNANIIDKSEELIDNSTISVWEELKVKYTSQNKWQSIPKDQLENSKRYKVHGVEVRKLPSNHFLSGQYGLFATKKFFKFDIVGEYTGKVV
eukprot:gene6807-9322_t